RLSRRLIGVFQLLALAGIALVPLRWMPPSDEFPPEQGTVEENNPVLRSIDLNSALRWPEDGFQGEVEEARQRSQKLEAEMRQPIPPSQSNDAALPWLLEAQQYLEKLERELAASTPNK